MNNNELWVELKYPGVPRGMYEISEEGLIRFTYDHTLLSKTDFHHSRNGYDYVYLLVDKEVRRKSPIYYSGPKFINRIDLLVAVTFVECNVSSYGIELDVIHKNGDTHDNHATNLEWCIRVEEWRDVINTGVVKNKYEISNLGNVREKGNTVNLLKRFDNYGYDMITLKLDHLTEGGYDSKPFKIHRLVACAWYGECNDDVNHINGVHNDNYVKNLEYISREGNIRHAVAIGKIEALSDDIIKEIYDDLKVHGSPKYVYEKLISPKYPRVSYDVVKAVKRGFYNHRLGLAADYKLPKCRITPTVEEMDMVRDLLIKYNGSPTKVFTHIDTAKHPSISSSYVITDIKRLRSPYDKSNKYSAEELEMIRTLGRVVK